jgi:hypothetical protein
MEAIPLKLERSQTEKATEKLTVLADTQGGLPCRCGATR